MPSPAARTGSPTESVGSSPGRGGSNRTSRKPVPVYDADELHEPRLPSDRPRPTNPNPFAAANALIAQQQGGADEPRTPPRGARPVTPQHKVRRSSDEDELSPTDRGERAFSRGSTSPTSTPPHTPVRIKRDASAERAPPVPTPQDEDDIATLNFNRRPSQFDPLAPSFHHAHGGSSTGSRQLVSATGFAPLPPVSPLRQPGQAHKRQRSSHTRQPSISLSSPSASPSTGGGFDTSTAASSATSTNVQYYGPSTLPPTESRKILPLQPAAQRNNGSVPPTRAPIEAFASVEMLQGQREHQDRTRGTEVFGPGGTYEGRASSLSGEAGLPVRLFAASEAQRLN